MLKVARWPRMGRLHRGSMRRFGGRELGSIGGDDKMPPKRPEVKPRPQLSQEQRRALELIAETPRGCTEDTILVVHGFQSTVLGGLIRDGLATSKPELVDASGRLIKVVRVNITDAGRQALKGSAEQE